jgi:hypothetical protein
MPRATTPTPAVPTTRAATPRKAAAPTSKRVPIAGTNNTVSRKRAGKAPRTSPEEARALLSLLIPPMDKYNDYISRDLRGVTAQRRADGRVLGGDLIVFEKAHLLQKNMIMKGDTGAGKSMAVEAYCAFFQTPLVVIDCHGGIDPNTFWGMLEQDPETKVIRWVDSNISLAMEHGPAVIFFDEVNFTPPRTFSVFHRALRQRSFSILERNNENRQVHPGTWFVAAYNPDDKYEGTRPLNKAFKNRFPMKFKWDYDPAAEKKLCSLPVMLEVATNLRQRRAEGQGEFETPVSTNMLIEFEDLCLDYWDMGHELAIDFAIANFVEAFEEDEQDSVSKVLNNNRDFLLQQMTDFEKSLH